MSKPVLYLATPYSHPDPVIRQLRYEQVTKSAARLIDLGHIVHSPITLTHPIEMALGGVRPAAFWLEFDRPFIEMCSELVVLTLAGWKESVGVAYERQLFEELGRPVSFLVPGYEEQRFGGGPADRSPQTRVRAGNY
jgi:hypothetical protein